MPYRYELITIAESSSVDSLLTSLHEAAELSNLHPEMIEEFLRGHLVTAYKNPKGEIYFDPSGISRLRQLAHLHQHEQTSLRMLRYIATLLDGLDAREQEIRELRERFR